MQPTKNKNHPEWLTSQRDKHWTSFQAQGIPTAKQERWKYTDLALITNHNCTPATPVDHNRLLDAIDQHRLQHGNHILLVSVNGYFSPELSDMHKLPCEVIVRNFEQALQTHAALIKAQFNAEIAADKYPFASLNTAVFTDGLFFYLPDGCELSEPVHMLSMVIDDAEIAAHPHHLFMLGANSKLSLVDEYFSLVDQTYMMNIVTRMNIGKAAQLDYYKIQNEGSRALHMANTFLYQSQDSQVNLTHFSSGAIFARDDVIVQLNEPGATCNTAGFYHLHQDEQYIDNHIDVNHVAPRCSSEMIYKGILDKKSRAVFNGRLYVEKDAQKTLAHQANHNLLLSNNAEVYSKPELEIYADDVKCKHGATTGQLDIDALFYLQSRGIDRNTALSMLTEAFANDITARVKLPGVMLRIQEQFMIPAPHSGNSRDGG